MRTARSNQSDFKIKSIQLQNPINPNTKWISGKLQNSSSEGPVRHLLPAAKTEGEQNAVRAWRKGKDLNNFFLQKNPKAWKQNEDLHPRILFYMNTTISLQMHFWWFFLFFRCGKTLSRKWGEFFSLKKLQIQKTQRNQ